MATCSNVRALIRRSGEDKSMKREQKIQRALRAMDEFRCEVRESDPAEMDLLQMERRLRDVLNAVGRECMAEVLEVADTKVPVIEYQGEQWGNRRESPGTYTTTFGDCEVDRSTYQRGGGGKVAVPLDLRLGIVERRYTPQVARLLARAIALMPSEEAEGWLQEAGVAAVSRSTLDRIPKAVAARYERDREAIEKALREEDEVPDAAAVVQVSLDGVMVPQDGEHAKRRGRKAKVAQPARHEQRYEAAPVAPVPADQDDATGRAWHEAFVGTVAFWDSDGDHLKTTYVGRMPESGHETVAVTLEEELSSVLAERPDLDVSFASDGDALQWTQLEGIAAGLPQNMRRRITFNLDFWHACSYLHDAAVAALGDTADAKVQVDQWKATLKAYGDGAARVLKSLRYFRDRATPAARDELDASIGFLARQAAAGRMNYKQSLDWGHPIGTGPVEAAAKTLVNVRLKRAGCRYEQHGGQTILTFRASVLSQRFDPLWRHLHRTYQAPLREAA